ncbi:MAG: 2Fe-2S iron-sulfur cluster binding domain-containing protein [Cellvibrionaceae bacterium]
MVQVYYADDEITLEDNESVLDGLLRSGHQVPNSCRAGACQSCLMVSEDQVPPQSQVGLSEAQKSMGYFLSCSCKPADPIRVSFDRAAHKSVAGTVLQKTSLAKDIVRLRLKMPDSFVYEPGQFVTLFKSPELSRSYSLASVPGCEDFIELHIKRYPDGAFSPWVSDDLEVGTVLQVQGPKGVCFYALPDNEKDKPLLLVGLSTGLAPLYGIVRSALQQGHTGPINLIVGSKHSDSLYLLPELVELMQQVPNVSVYFLAQDVDESDERVKQFGVQQGDIYEFTQEMCSDLKEAKVFLCGAESFVKKMKRQCFMAGAGMKAIFADAFLPT